MSDQCLGEIRMFAGSYAPEDWALCNGQLLPIADNEALFSILGTAWGGDGRTDFGLPDLRSRVPLGQGRAKTGTNYPLGQKSGTETVTLTEAELPTHTHAPMATSVNATTGNPAGNLMAQTVNSNGGTNEDAMYLKVGAPLVTEFELNLNTISPEGGTQSHGNIMPCTPVTYIIALKGSYPNFQ